MNPTTPIISEKVSAQCGYARPRPLRAGAFGRRFLIGLAIGLVWLGPAWRNANFIWALAVWDAAMALIWLADWARLPAPGELTVTRAWNEALYQGERVTASLEVENASATPLLTAVEDDVPSQMREDTARFEMRLRPRSRERVVYSVLPKTRGDLRFGKAYLRVTSPLQFAERWLTADLEQTVRVYPRLPDAKRQAFYLIRGRQLELERRRILRVGLGREFDSLREFRAGDERRDICWTATARRAKLITKTYQAERSQSVYLMIDAGRLMRARIRPPHGTDEPVETKLDHAVSAALTLARVALSSGDMVGLIAYGRRLQTRLAPARGAAQLRRLLDHLALVESESPEANHARAAQALLEKRQRRSLVIWLTDMAETAGTPEVIEAAARLSPHHLVLFAAIAQPDLNLLAESRPDSAAEMYRHAAAVELTTRRELSLRRLRQQGAMAFELPPHRLATGLVNEYLLVKERRLL